MLRRPEAVPPCPNNHHQAAPTLLTCISIVPSSTVIFSLSESCPSVCVCVHAPHLQAPAHPPPCGDAVKTTQPPPARLSIRYDDEARNTAWPPLPSAAHLPADRAATRIPATASSNLSNPSAMALSPFDCLIHNLEQTLVIHGRSAVHGAPPNTVFTEQGQHFDLSSRS